MRKMLLQVGRVHVSFLGPKATGAMTLAKARAATRAKVGRVPKGMRADAILDSGRVDESWVWASFDDAGNLLNVRHGADALAITP